MSQDAHKSQGRVLVTGASGFLGRRLVARLCESGWQVRALTRRESQAGFLHSLGAEPVIGDVGKLDSLRPAFAGVDAVIHAAADTGGNPDAGRQITIGGTRNILELCTEHRVSKLVYISSCSVYGTAALAEHDIITEDGPLEPAPAQRGPYSWAKYQAEQLVLNYMREGGAAIVCLRPGTIYGVGGELFTPMLGFGFKRKIFALIGDGRFVLPLVYVDNLVDAIMLSLERPESVGRIYNVVDAERVDKKRYMQDLIIKLHPGARYFCLPFGLLMLLVRWQEKLFALLGKEPFLTHYRLASSQKNVVYASARIQEELGWESRFSFAEAAARIIESV